MNKKIFAISVIVFTIDQIIKGVLSVILVLNHDYTIIPSFFNITLVNNSGAAWGVFPNLTGFLIIGSICALILIYRYMNTFQLNERNMIAFGLLTGGILGNLANRVMLGYVIDFFNFSFIGFPIFNIADMTIVGGVILLIYAIIKGEDKIAEKSQD